MTIPAITLTGVDIRTDLSKIEDMIMVAPHINYARAVEFAILLSPKGGQDPRYPKPEEVRAILERLPFRTVAVHLCGGFARMVHDGQWDELASAIDLSRARRVQVNSSRSDELAMLTLQRFSIHLGGIPVIMQWRGDTFPLVPGLHLLQDRSGGRGIEPVDWIAPDDRCRSPFTEIGYAGGLNPSNIGGALAVIARQARRAHFWVDCESGVRTNDWFDAVKALAMIDAVMTRWLHAQNAMMPFIVGRSP